MKKLILSGAIAAITGLAIASGIAQTQSTTTQTTTTGYIQSSSVLGAKIKDSRGQDVGEIKDFVLDRNTGCLAYVVVSTGKGGILSTSTKTVAAPWSVFSSSSDPRVYTTRVERERIYSAPVWESTHIDEYSRTDYMNNVYGYYGVPAPRFGMEMNIGTSTTGTTTTGINTTGTGASTTTSTGSAASSYATASPAASVGATVSASPSGSVSESTPSASATARSTMSPMGTPMRNPASKATTPRTSTSASGSSSSSTSQDASSATSTKAERAKKSEKSSTKSEATSEKPESASGDSPSSKSSKTSKHKTAEPGSTPDAASTPQE